LIKWNVIHSPCLEKSHFLRHFEINAVQFIGEFPSFWTAIMGRNQQVSAGQKEVRLDTDIAPHFCFRRQSYLWFVNSSIYTWQSITLHNIQEQVSTGRSGTNRRAKKCPFSHTGSKREREK
jgi:phosphotransferase system IIA component